MEDKSDLVNLSIFRVNLKLKVCSPCGCIGSWSFYNFEKLTFNFALSVDV